MFVAHAHEAWWHAIVQRRYLCIVPYTTTITFAVWCDRGKVSGLVALASNLGLEEVGQPECWLTAHYDQPKYKRYWMLVSRMRLTLTSMPSVTGVKSAHIPEQTEASMAVEVGRALRIK